MSDQLVVISVTQLKEIIQESISKLIPLPLQENLVKDTKYLSREKVCELLHITLPTLDKHSKKGLLKAHYIGRRVLYNEDEILSALAKDNIFLKSKRVA